MQSLESARRELHDSSDDLSLLTDEVLNDRIASLCLEKDRLESECARRLSSLSALQQRKSEMEDRISALRSERSALEKSIVDLGEERSKMEIQLGRIGAELAEVQAQTERQTGELEIRSMAVSSYAQKVQESTEFIKGAEAELQRHLVCQLTTAIDLPTGGVTGIGFGPNCQSVMAIGENKRFCQFGLPALGEVANFSTVARGNGFRLHADGQRVAIAGADNVARVISLHTGRVLAELRSHSEPCTDCCWASPNQLMSSSKDRCIKIFDVNTSSIVATVIAMSPVFSLCETGNSRIFAAGCVDGSIRLVDIRDRSMAQRIERVHGKQLTCVTYCAYDDLIYSVGLDNTVAATSITGGGRVKQFTHPEFTVTNPLARISIDPMGGFLAAGSANGAVVVFHLLDEGGSAHVLTHHKTAVAATACAANLIIAADQKGLVSFWS
jgi:uncharacterized small protein (DUF1192 family)